MIGSTTNPHNIKRFLSEAQNALPHSLKSNIEAAKGADVAFDVAAPDLLRCIDRLQYIFSEVKVALTRHPPEWRLIGLCLSEAALVNVSLLRLCNSVSATQKAALDLSGGGDAIFCTNTAKLFIRSCAVFER